MFGWVVHVDGVIAGLVCGRAGVDILGVCMWMIWGAFNEFRALEFSVEARLQGLRPGTHRLFEVGDDLFRGSP